MQRFLSAAQARNTHILLAVEINDIIPGMSGELLSNSGIQATHIVVRLLHMQHRCIFINLFTKAKGLDFAIKANCSTA